MTTTPDAPALNTLNILGLPGGLWSTDVQPFTYRSAASYSDILEGISTYLQTTLPEYLSTNFTELADTWAALLSSFMTGSYPITSTLDARYRNAIVIPVGVDLAFDWADTIQTALNTGSDVIVTNVGSGQSGIAKVSHTLRMSSNQGQHFVTRNATLFPTFTGDTVQMVTRSFLDVQIDGAQAPAVTLTGPVSAYPAAVHIGSVANSWNPQQGSVANTIVRNYKGNGFNWEAGAMIDFTHAAVYNGTGDGFNATATGNDNNHGHFANTHAVSNAGVGYNILGDGSNLSAGGSRHNVFTNAKGFGNGQNFFIATRSNVGTVFSELGTTPDQFAGNSRGNKIEVAETAASFEAWVDNGQGNQLSGYSSNNAWETKALAVRALVLPGSPASTATLTVVGTKHGITPYAGLTLTAGQTNEIDTTIAGFGDHWTVRFSQFNNHTPGLLLIPHFNNVGRLFFTAVNVSGTTLTNIAGSIPWVAEQFA